MTIAGGAAPLELWGGVECTVNRVGDEYRDQTILTGHQHRPEDLDRFAALGLAAIRYPVLWERIAPDDAREADWGWTDARLARLQALGIRPIAGLVHHGSGPRGTDLLDPHFAEKLGRFAGRAAERYPWIEDWTPVNEPLTTARFSALYGHWYPHRRDERCFWLALLNQVEGVRAAMAAIRRVRPSARLIQTDDLGHSFATPALQPQAEFDNARRWAGWDLLCGRLVPGHPLWRHLTDMGLAERLRAFADAPCPPDVIGVNHYVTSDRFLDERIDRYPAHVRGGNGRMRYADVEAVRVLDPAPQGWRLALAEAWARYRLPLALTEVHLGCTREEQLRFAAEAWDSAVALRTDGVDVRAVTAWSLNGSSGWNTLLTAPGLYEPGLFDVRGDAPRPTALAALWPALASGGPRHPAAAGAGWWRRPERLLFAPVAHDAPAALPLDDADVCPLLILDAPGPLGQALAEACGRRGLAFHLAHSHDPGDGAAAWLNRAGPWAVIDTGADATVGLACAARGVAYIVVEDGDGATEDVSPDAGDRLVVRTTCLFSPDDRLGWVAEAALALARGGMVDVDDGPVTPTYVPHLAHAVLDLAIDGATGLLHVAGPETLGRADFARRLAGALGVNQALVRKRVGARAIAADRPPSLLPPLQSAVDDFAAALHPERRCAA